MNINYPYDKKNNLDPEGRKALLVEALNWGESGIDLWLESIRDPDLGVRALAYGFLKKSLSPRSEVLEVLEQGIPVNPGDPLFCVYQAGVFYTDEYYVLSPNPSNRGIIECQQWIQEIVRTDLETQNPLILGSFKRCEWQQDYIPIFNSCYVTKTDAETRALSLHKEAVLSHLIPNGTLPPEGYAVPIEFETYADLGLQQWCGSHSLSQTYFTEASLTVPFRKWDPASGTFVEKGNRLMTTHLSAGEKISNASCDFWQVAEKIIRDLLANQQFDQVAEFYWDLVGPFAFVTEGSLSKSLYLKTAC